MSFCKEMEDSLLHYGIKFVRGSGNLLSDFPCFKLQRVGCIFKVQMASDFMCMVG
jgi:hypothetical protein